MTALHSVSGRLPERGRKRGEKIEESKNFQTAPPAPVANAIGPCPTIIQIVGRPGTFSLPKTIAPPDHLKILQKTAKLLSLQRKLMYSLLVIFVCGGGWGAGMFAALCERRYCSSLYGGVYRTVSQRQGKRGEKR